jgi:hypothetical protein
MRRQKEESEIQRKKMAVFWVVAPCSLVETYRRFRGACCLHNQEIDLKIEAASTSETSINFYQTTLRNNPEDSHLHTRRRENLKSYKGRNCRNILAARYAWDWNVIFSSRIVVADHSKKWNIFNKFILKNLFFLKQCFRFNKVKTLQKYELLRQ